MSKIMIGVMGGGDNASALAVRDAFELGKLIAQKGWVVVSGGRNVGVMEAVCKGAKESGGLTVGILAHGDKENLSSAVDIGIVTGMGSARNNINVLSSDIVVPCGELSAGTLSEVALALKAKKNVILFNQDEETRSFIAKIGGDKVSLVNGVQEVIDRIEILLD